MIVADGHGYINDYNVPVTVECIVREATKQQLEPEVVWAVLRQENGRVDKHSYNKNKTIDIGPMQINNGTMNKFLYDLQEASLLPFQQFRQRLYNDACFNVSVGAYVLRKKINAAGSVFKGIGWYHSANEPHYSRYLAKVKAHYFDLKRSPTVQSQLSQAKLSLYDQETAIHPVKSKVKSSTKKAISNEVLYYSNMGVAFRIPKSQIVYRK